MYSKNLSVPRISNKGLGYHCNYFSTPHSLNVLLSKKPADLDPEDNSILKRSKFLLLLQLLHEFIADILKLNQTSSSREFQMLAKHESKPLVIPKEKNSRSGPVLQSSSTKGINQDPSRKKNLIKKDFN